MNGRRRSTSRIDQRPQLKHDCALPGDFPVTDRLLGRALRSRPLHSANTPSPIVRGQSQRIKVAPQLAFLAMLVSR